jgi:short-subunit dehydrogenase
MDAPRQFAIVTGASSGIGYELAKLCAQHNYDLLVVADDPAIHQAAETFRGLGASVSVVEVDLATLDGVE